MPDTRRSERLPDAGSDRSPDRSRDAKLAVVKTVHTAFYVVQVAATLYILAAGVTGRRGRYLGIALALVTFESIVFFGRTPLSPDRSGAEVWRSRRLRW